MLGDVRYAAPANKYIELLASHLPRVKFFAAQALGRVGASEATTGLLAMLEENDDQDLYLRHAAVLALSRIGDSQAAIGLADHPKRSMRTAGVLVLRRLGDAGIAVFLEDQDEYIVAEAARAINDDWSIEAALPALANLLEGDRFESEVILRRAINAAFRVGNDEEIALLIDFAGRKNSPEAMRAEALKALASWPDPSVHDRVDGRVRDFVPRDPGPVEAAFAPTAVALLEDQADAVAEATAYLLGQLGITDHNDVMVALASNHSSAQVRGAMVKSLYTLQHDDLKAVIRSAMSDRDAAVRTVGIGYFAELSVPAEELTAYTDPIFRRGTVPEQQQLLKVLAEMETEAVAPIFQDLVDRWIAGSMDPGVSLELAEAVEVAGDETLITILADHKDESDDLSAYQEALYGGDFDEGLALFNWTSPAQCTRCHGWDNEAGSVGPSMRGVGSRLTREQILESIVNPSAKITAGFGSVILELSDGSSVSGILMEEHADELILKTSEAEPLEIPAGRIVNRQNLPSSMPPMTSLLTKREIRDIVEYLAEQE